MSSRKRRLCFVRVKGICIPFYTYLLLYVSSGERNSGFLKRCWRENQRQVRCCQGEGAEKDRAASLLNDHQVGANLGWTRDIGGTEPENGKWA